MNIELTIDKNCIDKIRAYKISTELIPLTVLILKALYQSNLEILNVLDDENKQKRMMLMYLTLIRLDLIESSIEEEVSLYTLTKKGVDLITSIQPDLLIKKEVKEVVVTEEPTLEDLSWISEWIELFPPRQYGRTYRHHFKDVYPRMKEFIKQYGFDKEVIIEATKKYIKDQENSDQGHKYTMESLYFIFKGKGSEKASKLASCCLEYLDSKNKGESEHDTSFMDIM